MDKSLRLTFSGGGHPVHVRSGTNARREYWRQSWRASSSLPSPQSLSPSHSHWRGMHTELSHSNLSGRHVSYSAQTSVNQSIDPSINQTITCLLINTHSDYAAVLVRRITGTAGPSVRLSVPHRLVTPKRHRNQNWRKPVTDVPFFSAQKRQSSTSSEVENLQEMT